MERPETSDLREVAGWEPNYFILFLSPVTEAAEWEKTCRRIFIYRILNIGFTCHKAHVNKEVQLIVIHQSGAVNTLDFNADRVTESLSDSSNDSLVKRSVGVFVNLFQTLSLHVTFNQQKTNIQYKWNINIYVVICVVTFSYFAQPKSITEFFSAFWWFLGV